MGPSLPNVFPIRLSPSRLPPGSTIRSNRLQSIRSPEDQEQWREGTLVIE